MNWETVGREDESGERRFERDLENDLGYGGEKTLIRLSIFVCGVL